MNDRTLVAADPEIGIFMLLHANDFMYNSFQNFSAEKLSRIKLCSVIFIDSMGDKVPNDSLYSNPKIKKMLKEEYNIDLPVVPADKVVNHVRNLYGELELLM